MYLAPLIDSAADLSRRADELDALADKIHDSPATKFRCADGTTVDLATILSPEQQLRVSAGCSFNILCAAAELRQAVKDARAAIETIQKLPHE
jgi:hypothetical protein